MNKTLRILLLAIGGALIGASANQLNTANGAVMFTLGILLAVFSMITFTEKNKKENKKADKKPEKINPYKQKAKKKK